MARRWRLAVACLVALLAELAVASNVKWVDGKPVMTDRLRGAVEEGKRLDRERHERAEQRAPNGVCFKEHASYVPLDMRGTRATRTENATMCQARCQRHPRCTRFAFYHGLKQCHITDDTALLGAHIVGFTSGPKFCRLQPCLTEMSTYLPWLEPAGFYKNYSKDEAVRHCQKLCLSVAACAHFILTMPNKDCHLAGEKGLKHRLMGSVSGPAICVGNKTIIGRVRLPSDAAEAESLHDALWRGGAGHLAALAGVLGGTAALAAVGFAAVRDRRRRVRIASIPHGHVRLDERFSADGVEDNDACLPTA